MMVNDSICYNYSNKNKFSLTNLAVLMAINRRRRHKMEMTLLTKLIYNIQREMLLHDPNVPNDTPADLNAFKHYLLGILGMKEHDE